MWQWKLWTLLREWKWQQDPTRWVLGSRGVLRGQSEHGTPMTCSLICRFELQGMFLLIYEWISQKLTMDKVCEVNEQPKARNVLFFFFFQEKFWKKSEVVNPRKSNWKVARGHCVLVWAEQCFLWNSRKESRCNGSTKIYFIALGRRYHPSQAEWLKVTLDYVTMSR